MDASKRDKWGSLGLNGGGVGWGCDTVVRGYLLSCHWCGVVFRALRSVECALLGLERGGEWDGSGPRRSVGRRPGPCGAWTKMPSGGIRSRSLEYWINYWPVSVFEF